jgi:5-formyltetrahydrofolate cyclo-ligase
VDTEPDTRALVRASLLRGQAVYLPRIRDYERHCMTLQRYRGGALRANRHGIPEPAAGDILRAADADLILVPTLAFNRRGARLGTGGGYYDRWLGRAHLPPGGRRPLLVGMAYATDELPALTAAAHDLRLDHVVTERGWIDCHQGTHR